MRFRIIPGALGALLCATPWLAPNLAAAPAPVSPTSQISMAKTTALHKAIARTGLLDGRSGASLWHDYGSFGLYRLSDATLSSLPADVRNQIQIDGQMDAVLFDRHPINTVTGSPTMPSRLTQQVPAGASLHLVQFVGPIKQEWLDTVRASGASPVQYVANNAYLVWANADARNRLASLTQEGDFVQYSGHLEPGFKLGASIENRILSGADDVVTIEVQIYAHADKTASQKAILALAVDDDSTWEPVLAFENARITVRAHDLLTIAQMPDVVWVGEYFPPRLLDEKQNQILAANFNSGKTGPSAPGYLTWLDGLGFSQNSADYPLVSVVDDGVGNGTTVSGAGDPTLTVLGQGSVSRVMFAENCTGDALADGRAGHGHINSSIIAGYDGRDGFPFKDPDGYLRGQGVNPYGRVGNTKFFNNAGNGTYCGGSYASMIRSEQVNGAVISSNSWGNGDRSYGAGAQAYDAGVRDSNASVPGNQQMIYIFAAGNDGPGSNTIGNPGNGKNMITVGASENQRPSDESGNWFDGCGEGPTGADNAMDVIGFSSRGPSAGGRIKPEVIAPGTHIQGTASTASGYDGSGVCDKYRPGGQTTFAASSGTSHSTPAVAGVASLYYRWMQTNHGLSAPSPAMMKAYLIAHPTYLTGASGNGNLPTNSQGYGMPDMETAFDATPRTLVDQTHVFDNTGETWTWDGTAADPTKPVRVVMTYTDAPGNTGSSPQVNNLDLAVTLGGNTYLGNRFSGQWSTPGGPADSANNYEAVFLPAGTSGPMNITITAANIAGDGIPNSGDGTDQDFALVCYNCAQDPGFTLTATPSSMELCAPDEATFAIDVGSILGFVSPATLSVSGTPAGTSAGFAPNPVTPPGTSTLTVGNTGAAAPGNYTLTLTGTATGGAPQSADIGLHLFASAPAGVALTSPAANATDVVLAPAFAWAAAAQASSYTIEVSGSSSFDSLITSASGLTSPAWIAGTTLSPNTTYYWRVRAENTCGSGTWSSTFSFTTGNPPFPQPYCDVSFPSNVEPITQVSFADINNSSSATINGTPALENFTHIIGHVEPGDSHVMTVKGNTAGNYSTPVKVYIDWNRDGTFANDANESYVIGTLTNSNGNDSKQVSAPIAIPATVTPGPVRMRVIKKWSTAADPCNNGGYGQAEDYTLLVTSGGSGPIIDVAPASLEASQPAGTLTTQVLVIENLGDSDLTWSIEEEPARPQPASLAFTGARGGHAGASDVAPRSNPTPQAAAIDEGFDDITALSGWLMNNHSDPLGSIDWFQGNDDVFSAFDGGDTAYIAANFNNAGSSGNIDNWLVTPIVNFEAVSTVSFYTRTADGTNWADRLEVRVCTSGACTDFGSGYGQVGEFTTVLLTVNESLDPTGYPQSWTQFTTNLPNSGSGRIAFRYFVPDNDTNSNYIGIDRVVIDADGGSTPVCSNPDDVSWLDVNPGSGTTSSGAASNVNVEFDATGMTAGTYAANLCINSNDPLNNLVIVPVSMTVTEAVDITFTVTPSVGSGTGMISPDDPQTVDEGDVATFVLTPINDQIIHSVGGTCGGHLAGDTYTTDPVTTDCTVIAHFDDVAIFDDEFED